MTFALSFPTPNATTTQTGTIFGIEVAIRTFTRAWMRYTRQEELLVLPEKPASWDALLALAASEGIDERRLVRLAGAQLERIKDVRAVFHPDPMFLNVAWFRVPLPKPGFALCSLAHTMTGVNATQVVAAYVNYPTQAGDAMICPSYAIRDSIRALLDLSEDYHNHRFGLTGANRFRCPVDLPVIPLGIDTDVFIKRASAEKRAQQRAALNLTEDEVAILFFGRLSYFSKSHPLPLLLAVERAAQRLQQEGGQQPKIRLLLMGYFAPAEIEGDYRKLIADICKTVQVDVISKDDPRFPDGLWAAADIFTSLVDNYQESFGLTPIEAMAAGLPAVITNWDGYRDGVRHGIDGVQIETIAPPAGAGMELAFRYANSGDNYGVYLAEMAQSVAIDIDAAAAAFALLAQNPEKRRAMGATGRTRAVNTYDWRVLIPQYEHLWDESIKKRQTFASSAVPANWPAVHLNYPDPYHMFASFPSHHLAWDDVIALAATPDDIETVLKHQMNCFAPEVLMPLGVAVQLLAWLNFRPEGVTLRMACAQVGLNNVKSDVFLRTIGWLLKNGFIRLVQKRADSQPAPTNA